MAGIILSDKRKVEKENLVWVVTFATISLNVLFYYLGAMPLYEAYRQSANLEASEIHLLIWIDILKWGLLAFVLVKLALRLQFEEQIISFRLLIPAKNPIGTVILWGGISGILISGAVIGISYLQLELGILDGLPWPYIAEESDTYRALGFWGGIRNLLGEEILTRVGAQAIAMYLLRKYRFKVVLSIIISSLYFEFWHNGFSDLYFLNFSASVLFGILYHYKGYEAAAVSHCVVDWLLIVIVPALFYG